MSLLYKFVGTISYGDMFSVLNNQKSLNERHLEEGVEFIKDYGFDLDYHRDKSNMVGDTFRRKFLLVFVLRDRVMSQEILG